jgi:hypothetical protein
MPTQIQLRRGTTANHSTFTGAAGEVTVDTTKKTVVVHDGATAGGFPLATETGLVLKSNSASPTFTGTVSGITAAMVGAPSGSGASSGTNTGDQTNIPGNAGTATTATNQSGGTVSATSIAYSTTLTGGTGVVNLGSGQVYKDASGNVGIGTSAPGAKLDVTVAGANLAQQLVGTSGVYSRMGTASSSFYTIHNGTTDTFLYTAEASALRLGTNSTERARIDASGRFLVGTTGVAGEAGLTVLPNETAGSAQVIFNRASTAASSFALIFRNAGSNVGNVSFTNTATAYATSSDYRLKNTVVPMTGALAKVILLKPVTYKWNIDGSDGQGFIAHELAEVEPGCVSGEKDAVDAEGKPQYQGIDTSFLVATLAAAIQEQQVLIKDLTDRLAALEAK